MSKFKVVTHHEMIIEAKDKEEAIEHYYDYTDGTELEATATKLVKRSKK